MTDFVDRYNFVTGTLVGILAYLFGEHWALFAFYLFFNITDFITGWIKYRLLKQESSKRGWLGILKKFGYWVMIFFSFMMSRWFIEMGSVINIDFGPTRALGFIVLGMLSVNEIRSILENLQEAGFPVPKILIDGLEVANNVITREGGEPDEKED